MREFDVVIIGGGIIGGSILYELSNYDLRLLLLEKNPILADETSKGNSGVIHCGFDSSSQKLTGKLNVLGNKLWQEKIFPVLNFPRTQVDSLVIAFNQNENEHLQQLYQRGLSNGVSPEHLKILDKAELLTKEPNLSLEAHSALLCTNSWAIDPVAATQEFVKSALQKDSSIELNAEVVAISYIDDKFEITLQDGRKYFAKNIINAAGHYADVIAKMASYPDFNQSTRRGEYRVLSRSERKKVNSILFMVPTIHGKGVIVAPMLDGRILVGPTAEEGVSKADTRLITQEKYNLIGKIGKKIVPSLKMERTEISFAGSRPISIETNDFIIRAANENKHFINVAGMKSPALSAAPAIALEVVKLIQDSGIILKHK